MPLYEASTLSFCFTVLVSARTDMLCFRKPSLEIISIRVHNSSPVFVKLAYFNGCSHIRVFRGDRIGYSLYENICIPCLLNWKTGSIVKFKQEPQVCFPYLFL